MHEVWGFRSSALAPQLEGIAVRSLPRPRHWSVSERGLASSQIRTNIVTVLVRGRAKQAVTEIGDSSSQLSDCSRAHYAMDLQVIVEEAILYRQFDPLHHVREVGIGGQLSGRYASFRDHGNLPVFAVA